MLPYFFFAANNLSSYKSQTETNLMQAKLKQYYNQQLPYHQRNQGNLDSVVRIVYFSRYNIFVFSAELASLILGNN